MHLSLVKNLIFTAMTIVVVSLLIWLFTALVPEPPVKEMENARAAIAGARDQNSIIYSARIFRESRSYYDSAMIAWRSENKRFVLFRDYERVRVFADIAAKKAVEATRSTVEKTGLMRASLEGEITRLKGELASFEKVFLALPLPPEEKTRHAKGKLLLKEAEIDLEKKQYVGGNVKITEANEYISGAYEYARNKLDAYYGNFSRWNDWARNTINESRNNRSAALIIEKMPARCHLYVGGKEKYSFDAEFGSNWMGDKFSSGDKATPEGMYMITRKLSNGSTKYHKALMINFPNKVDIDEFNERMRNGEVASDATIGDMIEIHGDGGKGANWTDGCIALRNSDMDILFKYVNKGTPVTIIGSSVRLEDYLSSREKP